ncbi:MAG: hypothetical protein V4615_07170 [Bacteroidota bacterium]
MKQTIALFFMSLAGKNIFARTGTVSDDQIIIIGPVLLIVIIGVGYWVKAKLRSRRDKKHQEIEG